MPKNFAEHNFGICVVKKLVVVLVAAVVGAGVGVGVGAMLGDGPLLRYKCKTSRQR